MEEQKKRILIIEDDLDTRDLYKEVLEEEGFNVETAEDGETGLKKAMEGGYNLILLDLMMYKVGGLTFLSQLKTTPPKLKNGNILLLTNLEQDSILKEGLSLGAATYIVKSNMNPGQVVEKVKQFI